MKNGSTYGPQLFSIPFNSIYMKNMKKWDQMAAVEGRYRRVGNR
jgi:hypothetical protein